MRDPVTLPLRAVRGWRMELEWGLHLRAFVAETREPDGARGAVHARARDGFFTERHVDPTATRVCAGISCRLAGGASRQAELERSEPCRRIYCAGYCDRSPIALRPDGEVLRLAPGGAHESLAPRPEIRCESRVPIVTERIARGDFSALAAARADGVWSAWQRALFGEPASLLAALEASCERGRGGAGFPTGAKWRSAAQAGSGEKVAIANGDEGDPGSFVDRVLLESDPHAVLEGLALCAFAIGARHGIVYVRSEYPRAAECVERAAAEARAAGLLGRSILGSGVDFDVRVVRGEGSYVCGEETALLNALEGKRGEVRVRPPYPTQQGLFGRPTVVNNVETLVNAAWIARHGPAAYRALGTRASCGTKALSLSSGFARPGIVEVELGASLGDLIARASGGARLAAVALGGPMGSVLLPYEWDVALSWEALGERGIELGHGGVVAIPFGADLRALALDWLEFMADESCGKCVPCRVGSRQALELARRGERRRLHELLPAIAATSLCAFGQSIPGPVAKLLRLAEIS